MALTINKIWAEKLFDEMSKRDVIVERAAFFMIILLFYNSKIVRVFFCY